MAKSRLEKNRRLRKHHPILRFFGIFILLLVLAGGGAWLYQRHQESSAVASTLSSAHQAIDDHAWQRAKTEYLAAQKQTPNVESRTALEQLKYVLRGRKLEQAKEYDLALAQYQRALAVDGALGRINQAVNEVMATTKKSASSSSKAAVASESRALASSKAKDASVASSAKRAAESYLASSKKAAKNKSSKAKKSSKNSSSTKNTASSKTDWTDASSTHTTVSTANLANLYKFSKTEIAAARADLTKKVTNVANYDDETIKKVMALQLINHDSEIADTYVQNGWGQYK